MGAVTSKLGKSPIFGRGKDLEYLIQRIQHPGVTFVSARPQQGKTRLFEELVDVLRSPDQGQPTHWVGYCEAERGVDIDITRFALENVYQDWCHHSSFQQQGRMLWQQHRDHITESLGSTFAGAIANIFNLVDSSRSISAAVKSVFEGLASANKGLDGRSFELPRLSSEQIRDALQLIDTITDRPVVLILDAFEQLSEQQQQAATLPIPVAH